ncbi:alpha/beta hydrolase [Mycoplasmopsis bovis]|nr:alpha/beta hydrolase [Mycoplasmopsis bovis]QQH18742.1 alpha/beta hydrolase [Mycoplasmopsis bovis]QQH20131.1 alpha/beta hydrolase [Mycoplasmopsis bovis]QQH23395.1 alpha/beta hydrolase [Mycoplasmopsis bovis]QQH23614.1 alpha/beta hydrolase [Mycoplasmopsis bovis]QQH25955.1 alpha/beta hydrolase [Mycoplasmopsis bovis]
MSKSEIIYDYSYYFKDNNSEQNIIFCHGFNSKYTALELFSSQHQKFNYYALQFPGSNLTKPVKNHKISVIYYAKLLIEFITKNNIKNITLIGKSMGAVTAVLAYKTRPELFKRLILITPINKTQLNLEVWKDKKYLPSNFEEYLNNFIPLIYYNWESLQNDSNWVSTAKLKFNTNYYNNEWVKTLDKELTSNKIHNEIEQAYLLVKIPTLIVLADSDELIDCEMSKIYFNKIIPNAKIEVIKDSAHMVYKEKSYLLNNIIEKFINE